MKKLVALLAVVASISATAAELQIKGGYDFKRDYISNDIAFDLKGGWTAGLEYLFDNQGEFEWGLGAEYKFGQSKGKVEGKYDGGESRGIMTQVPIYATGKVNLFTSDTGKDRLYLIGRVGYSINDASGDIKDAGGKYDDGLYLAGGVGTEVGPFAIEALYERTQTPFTVAGVKTNDYTETYGARIGYRIGNTVNDRSPKVVVQQVTVEKPVEKIVYVDRVVTTPSTTVIDLNCRAAQKMCIINGFKVDGKVPNEAEQRDLRTIANILNSAVVDGGTINVVGHTDSTGSAAYNQKLSVERAQNVARLLREYGLKNTVKFGTITGKGLTQPMATNNTVEGRYQNRRVELFFDKVDFTKANVKFIN
ncbi:OmpA family protein [Sebaldella sp. S0638]|uniref:OmpA family protein n=1 Tax=Sebaldella sp. S0638 TaxID=2957809 RepID=UPI0020A200C5|nr:OmpA family protein [Sebaldella sp. S0638]MCP1225866.1 OmpA family protein [Sebaldella sp. S0638]